MRPSPGLALPALALLLAACQGAGPAPVPAGPASGANAVAAGNASAANVITAPPPLVELRGAAALATAGPAGTALVAGSETAVDPRSSFRVELPLPLPDARLSLLDGGDAMVPCSGSREVGPATVLTLTPAAALPAGARLRLRVDGAATRELRAADGRRFAPLEWPVVVAGAPEPRKAPGRKGKRR
jgi:hypothetical protein